MCETDKKNLTWYYNQAIKNLPLSKTQMLCYAKYRNKKAKEQRQNDFINENSSETIRTFPADKHPDPINTNTLNKTDRTNKAGTSKTDLFHHHNNCNTPITHPHETASSSQRTNTPAT